MSGICGIIRFDGGPVARAELERMAERAAYRGPDGIEYHLRGPVGVACLSLDITPDGTGACRPVTAAQGQVVFLADARLDNRAECAAGGEGAIDPGRTGSRGDAADAELMLGAMLQNGGPERLVGDFAYALWDGRGSELRLGRDPLGVRSLYYRLEPHRVLFASELAQILAAGDVPRRLNERTVAHYLCGMQVPPGCVFYEGVEELKPGEEVVIDCSGHSRPGANGRSRVKARVYWRPGAVPRIRYRREDEYAEHLRELLLEAVRARLRSRAPVGISLSGGMDSATVGSTAGWLREQDETLPPLRAYSWAFSEFPECDERENIYRVAGRYGLPVSEIPAEETYPLVEYPAHGPHEDDPFTSMFQPFMERVLQTAIADGVAMMLYGFRGDVMFGGNVNDLPGLLRAGLFSTARAELAELARVFGVSKARAVRRYLIRPVVSDLVPRGVALSLRHGLALLGRLGSLPGGGDGSKGLGGAAQRAAPHVRREFLKRAGMAEADLTPPQVKTWRRAAGRERFRHIMSPLVMRGVQYSERLASGFGVAFGDPWGDRRIAEFVLACPQHVLDRALEVKRLPRLAMRGIMPDEAIRAADKVSPGPMYAQALRNWAYRTVIDLITDSRCAVHGYIDEALLKKQFDDFVRGEAPTFDLWSTLSLEIWLRRFGL